MTAEREMPENPEQAACPHETVFHGQDRPRQASDPGEEGRQLAREACGFNVLSSDLLVHLRATFDCAAVGMAWVSPNGRILESNTALQSMLGYSREELKGRRVAELKHPDDARRDWNLHQEVIDGKRQGYQVVKRYIRKDGTIFWGRLTFSVVRDAGGRIQFGVGALLDITEQYRTQQGLQQALQQMEDMIDGAPAFVAVKDLEGRFLTVNRRMEEAVGLTREQLRGKTDHDISPKELADLYREHDRQALAAGQPIQVEEAAVYHGRKSVRLASKFPLKDPQGQPYAVCVMSIDITPRKQAQEDNRRNEARLESLLRISQHPAGSPQELLDSALEEAIALTSSRIGYIYRYNEATKELTLNSWSREVMSQCTVAQPQTVYQLEKTGIWGEAVRQGRPIILNDFLAPHPLKKGCPAGHVPIQRFMTLPVIVDGHIVGVVGVANKETDYDTSDVRQLTLLMDSAWKIIDRKRTEEDLRVAKQQVEESLARLEAVVESMTDALIIADPQGNLVHHNPASIALHGYRSRQEAERPADKVGLFWEIRDLQGHLLSPQQWPIARAVRGDRFSGWELSVRRCDTGKEFIGSYSGTPVHDSSGRMILAIVTIRDVTEVKLAEEQLKALNETLERRVTERTAVAEERATQLRVLASQMTRAEERERRRVAHILHEHFQQLLVGAKFDISLLKSQLCGREECKAPPILERVNEVISQSIREARSLTVELSPPILYAAGLAEALHWQADWMRDKHGLEVAVQAEKAAEPASEDVRILLFQGVRELLFNIVKHAGVRQAQVRMDRSEQGHMRICVSDRGAGFDPRLLQTHGGAGGFGIFSLRERLEFQGGQLLIESAPGQGTTLVLTVPDSVKPGAGKQAGSAQAPSVERMEAKPRLPAAGAPGGVIRILVADDHLVVRDGLARLLQTQPDIEVIGTAADGQQAVEMALRLRPDVVLMDVSMPTLSGIDATRCIVSKASEVSVVGLSMHSDAGVASAMVEAGAIAYVCKTAPAESLMAAIRAAAENRAR